MSHPSDRLAPFVDGTLPQLEAAEVSEHVRTCPQCRHEAVAAAAAREVLRALPAPDAPDLTTAFSPEHVARLSATAATDTSSGPAGARWTKVAPALAAAAVIALVALVVPRLGSSSGDSSTAADGVAEGVSEAGPETDAPLRLQLDDTDYDAATLDAAAIEFAASYRAEPAGGTESDTEGQATATAEPEQARFAGPGRSAKAVSCLMQAFPGFAGEIVQVRRASFAGTPAFLGFVLERSQVALPPDIVSIWVAEIEDCSILSISSTRL